MELINSLNIHEVKGQISPSSAADMTGGMFHKIEEAFALAEKGIPSLLISGLPGNLEGAILAGRVRGTWIRK